MGAEIFAKEIEFSTQKPKKLRFSFSYHHTETLPFVFPIVTHCSFYTQC